MSERKKMNTEIEETKEIREEAPADEAAEEAVQEERSGEIPAEEMLKALQKEKEELSDKMLRLAAEYDNFRKRTSKEKLEMYAHAKAETAAEFLKVADTLERAIDVIPEDSEHKKGMAMILGQFEETLKNLGIEEIQALGEKFNPDFHNAVSQVENSEFGENTICQVYEKGYKMGDRVLRHSIVVVANP